MWEAFLAIGRELENALRRGGSEFQHVTLFLQQTLLGTGDAEASVPALRDFHTVLREYDIPRRRVLNFLDGWSTLLTRASYRDRVQIDAAAKQTGGAVVQCLAHILGAPKDAAGEPAAALGIAVANLEIIRALDTFMAMGRLPLPADRLDQRNLTVHEASEEELNAFLRAEIERVHETLALKQALLDALPNDGSQAFVSILAARTEELARRLENGATRDVEIAKLEAVGFVLKHRHS